MPPVCLPKSRAGYELAPFLLLVGFVILRQARGGVPVFTSEFILEDVIVLLAATSCIVPPKFKRLTIHVTGCIAGVLMTVLGWCTWKTGASAMFPLTIGFFAVLTIRNAVLLVKEVSKLNA